MEAAALVPADLGASIKSGLESYITENVLQWSALCQKFLDAEREHMLLREPTEEDLRVHRRACRLLLVVGRMWQTAIVDADIPQRTRLELEGRVHQLEIAWSQFQNPMPAEEADRILKEVFPE